MFQVKMNCGRHLPWFISLNGISLMILTTSIGVHCQTDRVVVGDVCLEVGYDGLIDCQYDVREGETLITITWGRSSTDDTSFPTTNVLASYHFANGKNIPAEHIGRIDLANNTFALMIRGVTETDILQPRYWCQANILGSVYDDYEDHPSSGIRRATPSISEDSSETTCTLKDNVYSCGDNDKITCSAGGFTPDADFNLTWTCEIGTPELSGPEPDGSFYKATNVLSFINMEKTTENVPCTCSASGSSNCNAGTLSKEVTINFTGDGIHWGFIVLIIVGIVLIIIGVVGLVYYKCFYNKNK